MYRKQCKPQYFQPASMTTTASFTLARRFLSTGGHRAVSSIGQISMHSNLEGRWQKLPIPKENLVFRLATMADKAGVLKIEPGIHYGLDYMDDYYDDIVTHPSRCGVVAVDKSNDQILTFAYAIVNEGGRNLSFGGGRTVLLFRDYGLMSYASRAIYEHVKVRLHSHAGCCGVYNLPYYTRRFFEKRRSMLEVRLHNQQLGFECGADYWAALAERFAGDPAGADEPKLVRNPVDFLSSEAVCGAAENRLFKPDQHLLIAKESTIHSRGNLVIWEKYLRQVMSSQAHPSGEVTAVSIANWTSVPIGGHHLVLNIYCRTESHAVSHLAAQLRSAVQRIQLSDAKHHRLYISAFVPGHLLYNEVLTGVKIHPLINDLPASNSPKLACDIRICSFNPDMGL